MDELIRDFLVEANEAIQKLDNELVSLERNPHNQELLGSIFRIMHTVKGTCGFLGLSRLEALAHAGENILGKIRDQEIAVSPEIISIILEAIDGVKFVVTSIEKNGSEPLGDDLVLIKKLNKAAGMEASHSSEETPAVVETPALVESPPTEAAPPPPPVEQLEAIPASQEKPTEALEAKAAPQEKHQEVETKPAPQQAEPQTTNKTANSNQSIRVNLEVLEGLMLIVSELVLTRNQLLQISRGQKDSEFSAPIQRLGHITSELQEKVMKTRMQPISNAWAPFPRLVRDLASELGKKINLKMIGEDTELDRQLIDAIKDPLTHMVRNSADHGLETPDVRVKSGKGEVGTITLNAYHQGGHIIIEISDDGRGLDEEKLKAKILKENLATEEEVAVMSKEQVYRYIFKAGFSTAAKVTSVSGRGVGMDVVDTNIKKINGHIDLNTKLGKGTSFFIKIPLTLAIMPVLIVECNKEKFAIPQINVLELVRTVESSGYVIENINQRPVLRLRNALLPLAHLAEILGFNTHENLMNVTENDVIVCKIGGYHFGIIVDRVYDTEEIVVKPVAPVLKSIDIYSGITLLGDGSVIMILDPNGIMKWLANTSEDNTFSNNEEHEQNSQEEKTTKFLLVKAGNVTKAIPLELVDRIEEIDVNNIEHSGEKQIIQYRDKLMYLSKLCDEDALKSDTKQPVVSFTDEEKILGIMVEEIIDIVEHKLEIISCLSNQGALGSMVINDKTTDIVDVAYYFTSVFGKNLIEPKALVSKAPPRILMIDDSLFFRKIIPEVLLKKGYDVIGTESGAKGLEILEKDRNFIGMIVDYNMSGINGLEFADLCQSNPMLQNIPLIILSAAHEFNQQKNHPNIKAFVSKNNHEHLIKMIEECFILNSAIVEKV